MDENAFKATGKYHDVAFLIGPDWRFRVPSLDRSYDTHRQMTEAIDRVAETEKKAKKKCLALECLTEDGQAVTITGIHAGNGQLLLKPSTGRHHRRSRFYPVVPWIADALKRISELKTQAAHIRDAVDEFSVYYTAPYPFTEGEHARQAESLDVLHGKTKSAAEKTTFLKALADTPAPKEIEFD